MPLCNTLIIAIASPSIIIYEVHNIILAFCLGVLAGVSLFSVFASGFLGMGITRLQSVVLPVTPVLCTKIALTVSTLSTRTLLSSTTSLLTSPSKSKSIRFLRRFSLDQRLCIPRKIQIWSTLDC